MSSAIIKKLEVAPKGGSRASMHEALEDARSQINAGQAAALAIVLVTPEGVIWVRQESDADDPKSWITLRGALALAATENT